MGAHAHMHAHTRKSSYSNAGITQTGVTFRPHSQNLGALEKWEPAAKPPMETKRPAALVSLALQKPLMARAQKHPWESTSFSRPGPSPPT